MLYGSTKIIKDRKHPELPIHINPSYNLTKTQYVYDLTSIKQLSIRKYKDVESIKIKDYEYFLKKMHSITNLKNEGIIKSKTPRLKSFTIGINQEEINELYNMLNYKFTNEEQERIAWAKALIAIINKKRADDYHDWLLIGWALHNTHTSLFPIYVEFSKQSNKFDEASCLETWKNTKSCGRVCNLRTLEHYAQIDNKEKYDKLFNDIHMNLILDVLNGNGSIQKEMKIIYTKYVHL